jgi:copper(I)-binding protein
MARPGTISETSRGALIAAKTAILIVVALAGCNHPQHREHGLAFRDWYVATPMANGTMTVAYGSIENLGANERHLLAVSLSCAESAELHETLTSAGHVSMRALPSVIIPPAGEIRFAPGGKHLMVFGFKNTKDCQVKFTFGADESSFVMPVKPREAK